MNRLDQGCAVWMPQCSTYFKTYIKITCPEYQKTKDTNKLQILNLQKALSVYDQTNSNGDKSGIISYNNFKRLNQPVMNKQNAYKNVSLVNYKQIKIPSKTETSQMAFRNINAKSFVQQHRDESSRSPAATKRTKMHTNRVENSLLHTQVSESVIGVQNNNLMEAFRLERQSLMNTVKLYKEQIQVLTQQNLKLKKESSKIKSRTKQGQRDQTLKQEVQKRLQLSKKVQEYQTVLPKLVELEQMSENIVSQNNLLKTKIKVQQALLNNVAHITKYQEVRTPALQKIWGLTQAYFKGSSISKKNRKN